MDRENLLMHYGVRITPIRKDSTGQIAFLAYATLPDGRILQSQCVENLAFLKERGEIISMLSSSITARLTEGLYKDIQDKISKIIFEEIKQ